MTSGSQMHAGGIIGSSFKLLDELIELAPYLGVQLQANESLSPEEAQRIHDLAQTQGATYEHELKAWLTLHQAAELSLMHQTAIYFA